MATPATGPNTYEAFRSPQDTPQQPQGELQQVRRRKIEIEVIEDDMSNKPIWMYPAGGSSQYVDVPQEELELLREKMNMPKHMLSEWPSTAISGNDILSSVLYSSGLVALKAGKLCPIPLVMVSIVLYFFRFIYEEVVTAIPLNGGSYNVLLNTTSKRVAALAAGLGILSYLATGVVSASSALYYINTQVYLPVVPCTIGLLFLFAVLCLIGITESSVVALMIFVGHIATLSTLVVTSIIYMFKHPSIFKDNMKTDLPPVEFAGNMIDSNVPAAIFFGFGAALLGITGFESSANFVEEQQPGVFRKTLRNMWGLVALFNALLSVLALGVLPLKVILSHEKNEIVLAEMGRVSAGKWLEVWVSVDALVVLSGAVLTSYVGINGLVKRLACDRIVPGFFLRQNSCRKTNHVIILTYFVVASSLVWLLDAKTTILGGVYTYAFLGLMVLFTIGCMLLKAKRAEIPRDIHAPWWTCIMGATMVTTGIFANLLGDPKILMYFMIYFILIAAVMFAMLERVTVLRGVLAVMKKCFPSKKPDSVESPGNLQDPSVQSPDAPSDQTKVLALDRVRTGARGGRTITKAIMNINEPPIVFFCKHLDMTVLNKAVLYVRRNEQTHNMRVVHVAEPEDGNERVKQLEEIVRLFDYIYPKLRIDFVCVRGHFDPVLVEWISSSMSVPTNMMFIAQPGDKNVHKVAQLGVRVITG